MKAGQTMGDAAEQEPFEQISERLLKELIEEGCEDEAPESVTTAYLDYVVKRERIRQGATDAGRRQDAVDYETLETLKNAQLGNPKFVEAEAIFRRLGTDPVLALRYYEQLITQKDEQLSLKMSKIAKKPRPQARKICSEAIMEFVSREPDITPTLLLRRFKDHQDFEVEGEFITHITERDVMKTSSLRMSLSRAKKKHKKNK